MKVIPTIIYATRNLVTISELFTRHPEYTFKAELLKISIPEGAHILREMIIALHFISHVFSKKLLRVEH
jgi:hypothetical protein